ncbi:MAG: exosortase [Pedosphaera sp.]|nr:exosortase [Pedosphaera sp.]
MASLVKSQTCGAQMRWAGFIVTIPLLILIFFRPIAALTRLSGSSELYSHVMVVPLLSAYLIWIRRNQFVCVERLSLGIEAGIGLIAGCGGVICLWLASAQFSLVNDDYLFFAMISFVSFMVAAGFYFGGKENTPVLLFPLCTLFLMVPLPSVVTHSFTVFLQHGSAEVAYLLIKLTGTPIARDGLTFMLPGLSVTVAEECSGIRSTMVLLITSLVGGYMFLTQTSHRAALLFSVLPIAIMRNGLRILTISWLTVHVDRESINGPVHKHGGPPFFILSLLPLFGLLLWFRKRENRVRALAGKVDRGINAPQTVTIR